MGRVLPCSVATANWQPIFDDYIIMITTMMTTSPNVEPLAPPSHTAPSTKQPVYKQPLYKVAYT